MLAVKIFAEDMAVRLKEYLPPGYRGMEYRVVEVPKNNGIYKTGLYFRQPGEEMEFVVYMGAFYQEAARGKALDGIMGEIISQIDDARAMKGRISRFQSSDFSIVREQVSLLLINTRANRRMLRTVPHVEIEDLSAVCRIELPIPETQSDIRITGEHLKRWGIGEKELFHAAFKNMEKSKDYVLQDIAAVTNRRVLPGREPENLLEYPETFVRDPKLPLYVLSNRRHIEGASALLCPAVMEKVGKMFPEGFYILPSSIHDVVVLPKEEGLTPETIRCLLPEFSKGARSADFLSDNLYEYDRNSRKIRQLTESVQKERGWSGEKEECCSFITAECEGSKNLDDKVKLSGLSREAYLRQLISGVVPRNAPPPDYYAMMKELHKIGNNLNQIAQKAHALNMIDVQRYNQEMQKFHEAVRIIIEAVVLPEKAALTERGDC